jgi:hypothetical protein
MVPPQWDVPGQTDHRWAEGQLVLADPEGLPGVGDHPQQRQGRVGCRRDLARKAVIRVEPGNRDSYLRLSRLGLRYKSPLLRTGAQHENTRTRSSRAPPGRRRPDRLPGAAEGRRDQGSLEEAGGRPGAAPRAF